MHKMMNVNECFHRKAGWSCSKFCEKVWGSKLMHLSVKLQNSFCMLSCLMRTAPLLFQAGMTCTN